MDSDSDAELFSDLGPGFRSSQVAAVTRGPAAPALRPEVKPQAGKSQGGFAGALGPGSSLGDVVDLTSDTEAEAAPALAARAPLSRAAAPPFEPGSQPAAVVSLLSDTDDEDEYAAQPAGPSGQGLRDQPGSGPAQTAGRSGVPASSGGAASQTLLPPAGVAERCAEGGSGGGRQSNGRLKRLYGDGGDGDCAPAAQPHAPQFPRSPLRPCRVTADMPAGAGPSCPLHDAGAGLRNGAPPDRGRSQSRDKPALECMDKAARQAAKERDRAEKQRQKEKEKKERAQARAQLQAARKAAKAAEKQRSAAEREQERRQKGKFAQQEIVVHLNTAYVKTDRVTMDELEAAGLQFEVREPMPLSPHACLLWTRRRPAIAAPLAADYSQGTAASDLAEEQVPYVLLYFKAEEFVGEVERDGVVGLVRQVATAHPGCTLCLLVVGLDHYLTTRERREFRVGSGAPSFGRAATEEAVMALLVRFPALRHRALPDAAAAAQHIVSLTRALADQPHKDQPSYLASFGGSKDPQEDRQLKAALPGHAKRTLFDALLHVPNLGPKSAHAISSKFSSLGRVLQIYNDPSRSERDKEALISELTQVSNRRVGPAAAKKVWGILSATDPNLALADL